MKIIVDRALCDGNGNCVQAAPGLLALTEDDTVEVLEETFGEDHRAAAQAAADSCPKAALRLVDDAP